VPLGHVLAWVITLTEIFGSLTMAAGFVVRYVAGFFILELFTGIILVHWRNGWFVVGGGDGRNGVQRTVDRVPHHGSLCGHYQPENAIVEFRFHDLALRIASL
jgi:uncharacterized membrane protein YphA (DoxX/SURF4 family)